MPQSEKLFIDFTATYELSLIEAKKSMYNWEMMVEFAEFINKKQK